jgi:hypothetical protein
LLLVLGQVKKVLPKSFAFREIMSVNLPGTDPVTMHLVLGLVSVAVPVLPYSLSNLMHPILANALGEANVCPMLACIEDHKMHVQSSAIMTFLNLPGITVDPCQK